MSGLLFCHAGLPASAACKRCLQALQTWFSRSSAVLPHFPPAPILPLFSYFAHYFGLKDVSSHIDAAFQTVEDRFTMVSDNEHVLYINALKPGKVA